LHPADAYLLIYEAAVGHLSAKERAQFDRLFAPLEPIPEVPGVIPPAWWDDDEDAIEWQTIG